MRYAIPRLAKSPLYELHDYRFAFAGSLFITQIAVHKRMYVDISIFIYLPICTQNFVFALRSGPVFKSFVCSAPLWAPLARFFHTIKLQTN